MRACSHRHGWSGNNNLLAWDLAQLSVYSIFVFSITSPKVSVCILISLYLPDVVGPSVDKLLLISVTAKEWFWSERLYFKRLKTLFPGFSYPSTLLVFYSLAVHRSAACQRVNVMEFPLVLVHLY